MIDPDRIVNGFSMLMWVWALILAVVWIVFPFVVISRLGKIQRGIEESNALLARRK